MRFYEKLIRKINAVLLIKGSSNVNIPSDSGNDVVSVIA
jgi:hypothetical protein